MYQYQMRQQVNDQATRLVERGRRGYRPPRCATKMIDFYGLCTKENGLRY
jgi:hypothetical protein